MRLFQIDNFGRIQIGRVSRFQCLSGLAILLYFLFSTGIFSESIQNKIQWDEVEGAIQYNIEIKKDDKLIEEKTKNSEYEILLKEEGIYEYRIGAENKLGSILWTDWKSIKVEKKKP